MFFSEESLSAFLHMVWAGIQFVSRKFLYLTTTPFSNGTHLVMLVGGKGPGGTPTGQVAGGWLISHPPFPSRQNTQNLPKPMCNYHFGKYDLNAMTPTTMHQCTAVNRNPLLMKEGPHSSQYESSLLPNALSNCFSDSGLQRSPKK